MNHYTCIRYTARKGCSSPADTGPARFLCWNCLWILLFAVGMGFFLIGTPKQVDDYAFLGHLKYWYQDQGIVYPESGGNIFTHGIPFEGVVSMIRNGWHNDNIRMVNILATFLLCFPKWVGSGLMLLLLALAVREGFKLAGIDARRSALVPLGLLMWTFLLPWDDNFGSFDFQINYILPAWLGFMLLRRLKRSSTGDGARTTLNMLLALMMGVSHEGSGMAFAAGLLALFVCDKRWRRADVLAAIVLISAGSLFLLSAPGMVKRGQGIHLDWITDTPSRLRNWNDFWISEAFAYTAFIIMTAVCLAIRRRRFKAESWLMTFTLVSATAAIIIRESSHAGPRMLFWPDAICIAATLQLLRISAPNRFRRYTPLTAAGSGVILVLLFTNLAFAGYYSLKCRETMRMLVEARVEDPETYNFGDACMTGHIPAICGTRPGNCFAHTAMLSVEDYYGTWDADNIRTWFIIPAQFEHVTAGEGRDVSGGQGLREIDGFFYMPYDEALYERHLRRSPDNPAYVPCMIDFGDGPEPWHVSMYRFRSKGDGQMYVWCMVRSNWYTSCFKKIRSVTIDGYPVTL